MDGALSEHENGQIVEKNPAKFEWTFERIIEMSKLILVTVLGSLFALIFHYPQYVLDRNNASATSLRPTEPDSELTIKSVKSLSRGECLYDVSYSVSTRNNSGQATKITYSIAQFFIGRINNGNIGNDPNFLNDPPTPWDDAHSGVITWDLAGSDVGIESNDTSESGESKSFLNKLDPLRLFSRDDESGSDNVRKFLANLKSRKLVLDDPVPGDGLVGWINPTNTNETTVEYLVKAHPDDFAGMVVSYGIDNAISDSSPKVNLTSDRKKFSDLDASQTQPPASSGKPDPCGKIT